MNVLLKSHSEYVTVSYIGREFVYEILSIVLILAIPSSPSQQKTSLVTVAGGHGEGCKLNQLHRPYGLFIDEDQILYITDSYNHRIMGWKVGATTGEVLAGGNNEGSRLDQLNCPTAVIVDRETDSLLICDRKNRRVMRWPRRPSCNRQPEIVIDNNDCYGLTMDDQGSLYVSDHEKHEVRRYDKNGDKNGIVIAGGHGQGNNLNQLNKPTYLFIDAQSTLYVSDLRNHRVMAWVKGAKEGIIVAGGNGHGNDLAHLSFPRGVWVDEYGHVYVVDQGNHRVMRWENGVKLGTVIAGGNGKGAQANQLFYPGSLLFDRHGHLYVADKDNHRVQRFSFY